MKSKFTPLLVGLLALIGINPRGLSSIGVAAYPGIAGQDVSDLVTLTADAQQVIYELDMVTAAEQESPFGDNMTGGMGSGKPFINHDDTTKVQGQEIVIPTDEALGGPGVYGSANPAGLEEQELIGAFRLKIGLYTTTPVAITGAAMAQTVAGAKWPLRTRQKITNILAKKQSDDQMMELLTAATQFNTVYPVGKTLDTISSSDVFTTDLIISGNGRLRDIGALKMNSRPVSRDMKVKMPAVPRYLCFLTDALARPIKGTSTYLDGLINSGVRGDENRWFTGEYSDIDGNVIYPWENKEHAARASIGSALQPEALLGTAIPAKGATSPIVIDGGGSNAAVAALPYRAWFEFFSLYPWVFCNGNTATLGTGTRFFAIKDATDGKISLFSYTGNVFQAGITTKNQLTGIIRLGSTTVAGDATHMQYATTIGNVSWSTSATPPALGNGGVGSQGYTTVADGNGFLGLSEGAIAVGSHIYEVNANGQPIGRGLHLGSMAGVSGYGKVADLETGGFKTAAQLVEYVAPYGTSKGVALRISYGTKAFLRPDSKAPNYVRFDLARSVPGFPVVGS